MTLTSHQKYLFEILRVHKKIRRVWREKIYLTSEGTISLMVRARIHLGLQCDQIDSKKWYEKGPNDNRLCSALYYNDGTELWFDQVAEFDEVYFVQKLETYFSPSKLSDWNMWKKLNWFLSCCDLLSRKKCSSQWSRSIWSYLENSVINYNAQSAFISLSCCLPVNACFGLSCLPRPCWYCVFVIVFPLIHSPFNFY